MTLLAVPGGDQSQALLGVAEDRPAVGHLVLPACRSAAEVAVQPEWSLTGDGAHPEGVVI